jgi:hypothetical protein
VWLNVCRTYPFYYVYVFMFATPLVLADMPTMWGDVVFYYQTAPSNIPFIFHPPNPPCFSLATTFAENFV